jgi:sensor histidine kinase YesM
MGSVSKDSLRRGALLFLLWTALGLFMFSQALVQKMLTRESTPWWHYLGAWLVGVWLWFLLSFVMLWLGRRFPLERNHWARSVVVHGSMAVVFSIGQPAVEAAILRVMGVFPTLMTSYAATYFFLLTIGFHQGVLTYWTVLAAQYGFLWYRRYQERRQAALRLELRSSQLERQLTEAHLRALKMQLQPHFLFNTLNAIMVLVRQQKGHEAEEMLARLSDLLRLVLEDVKAQEVPLHRELEYLQLYLAIEQVRFQDRMRVETAVDPAVLEAAVPHMVLQPILENSIRHGIGRSVEGGRIQVSACLVGSNVEITIHNDGPGIAANTTGQTRGIGLDNTRARLMQLYGEAARLTVENAEQGGVTATIALPFRVAAEDSEPDSTEQHALHGLAG